MIRNAVLPALLLIVGCSQPSDRNVSQAVETTPNSSPNIVATLSCTVNGTAIAASACLVGSSDGNSGSLKVRSAGSTTRYTDYQVVQQSGPTWDIPLSEPFEITAQANDEDGYVLRMVIRSGTKTIFQDETSQFGVISADSDALQ